MADDSLVNRKQTTRPKVSAVMIDGQPLNIASMTDAIESCLTTLRVGLGFTLLTLNLDHMVRRRADSRFREAYARADFVSADGQPVVALARKAGVRLDRVTGADLVEPLCKAAAKEGIPIYLFGTTESALRVAADRLRAACPGLAIAGMAAPPMGFDPSGPLAAEASEGIAGSGARLCFVALPTVKQVMFMDRFHPLHPQIGFVGIGAALDFIAGTQLRAPLFFQTAGIEWVWRFGSQPRAMFRRYLACGLLYLKLRASRASAVKL